MVSRSYSIGRSLTGEDKGRIVLASGNCPLITAIDSTRLAGVLKAEVESGRYDREAVLAALNARQPELAPLTDDEVKGFKHIYTSELHN